MKINKFCLLSLGAIVLAGQPVAALANAEFERRVEERLTKLEQSSGSGSIGISDKLTFASLIELEAWLAENFDDSTDSDLDVATVEFGLGYQINDTVSANVIFLYEENDTPLDVDVATLTFADALGSVDIVVGKQYLPFGQFKTALVNDTLVLELAETNKTAVAFGFEQDGLTANAYIFDGDADREDNAENFGFGVGYQQDTFKAGVQFISSIAESDAISDQGLIQEGGEALNLYGQLDLDTILLIGEYVKTFSEIEIIGGEYEPEALQLEVDFPTNIGGREYVFGVSYQMTDDAAQIDLPEQALSFGGSTRLDENLSLAVEFFHYEDYDENDGGTGEDAIGIIAQIAAKF